MHILMYTVKNPGARRAPGFSAERPHHYDHGGEGEIRTLETLLTPTRFPVAQPSKLPLIEQLFDRHGRIYLPWLRTVHAP